MDNDSIHKFAYRHRELFADLLRLAVPNLAAELALDEAEEVSAAHVSAGEGSFEQRHGDMTWRVPFKEGALRDGTRPYLLVLLEFQSTVNCRKPYAARVLEILGRYGDSFGERRNAFRPFSGRKQRRKIKARRTVRTVKV